RHSGKEKVTLDDLFLLHSMDGGVSVDVPVWPNCGGTFDWEDC
ncbi:hypothetical protein Tco_0437389, partial [Tanacetum coccineum]